MHDNAEIARLIAREHVGNAKKFRRLAWQDKPNGKGFRYMSRLEIRRARFMRDIAASHPHAHPHYCWWIAAWHNDQVGRLVQSAWIASRTSWREFPSERDACLQDKREHMANARERRACMLQIIAEHSI